MELTRHTVMILIGLLVVVVIVIDGVRRMRKARAAALKLDISNEFRFPETEHNPELQGRARVVGGRTDGATTARQVNERKNAERKGAERKTTERKVTERKEPVAGSFVADRAEREPQLSFSASDEIVSPTRVVKPQEAVVASEPAIFEDEVAAEDASVIEPAHSVKPRPTGNQLQSSLNDWLDANSSEVAEQEAVMEQAAIIPRVKPANLDVSVPVLMTVKDLGAEPLVEGTEARNAEKAKPGRPAITEDDIIATFDPAEEHSSVFHAAMDDNLDEERFDDPHLEDEIEQQDEVENAGSKMVIYARDDSEDLSQRPPAEVVLVIHVRARDENGMSGLSLLHLFDGCDLRLGREGIFHRFEDADGRGSIQFSIAQTWEPGIFDPETMENEAYAGLTLFMSLPGASRPQEAYQAMSEMARLMSKHLNAELLDSTRSIFTLQTTEHDRQQISEFERRQHLANKQRTGKKR
ncbi:cell division protein ZipA C-terminal FtsZ-binding domain-containing protein [Parathalassolituus penaei]|uniref:Cell division protein ZipA n=1 Tax=Parathalassolituus penaei TaxID=2997323 RepID=A0A9X3EFD9_9GAMM|nr:cell division protein ZipA C-terminal FtsZ-binding domain-containing protein [Parathalassolituus penaei]MCY0966494.1 cell division protein ZipA C-terminal FtsZ-binding domain-containing protein [Parathalassolituus penaei]